MADDNDDTNQPKPAITPDSTVAADGTGYPPGSVGGEYTQTPLPLRADAQRNADPSEPELDTSTPPTARTASQVISSPTTIVLRPAPGAGTIRFNGAPPAVTIGPTDEIVELRRRLDELESAFNQARPLARALDDARATVGHNQGPPLLDGEPLPDLSESALVDGFLAIDAIRNEIAAERQLNKPAIELSKNTLQRVVEWLVAAGKWFTKLPGKVLERIIAQQVVDQLKHIDWTQIINAAEATWHAILTLAAHLF